MYAQSLCLPNASFPLLRTLHAISTAAIMTDTTTRAITTATTAPMIAPASLPGGAPPPAAGRSWDDVTCDDVIDWTKLLVTSGTVHSKHTNITESNGNEELGTRRTAVSMPIL